MKEFLKGSLEKIGLFTPIKKRSAAKRHYLRGLRNAGRRSFVRTVLRELGYELLPAPKPLHSQAGAGSINREIKYPLGSWWHIPDSELYTPFYSPWFAEGEFRHYYALAAPRSLVSVDRCYVLYTLLKQSLLLDGDVWECGVYKGGTAAMMAQILHDKMPQKKLYLFDTFEGMPETDSDKDVHKKGDFADTGLSTVMSYVGNSETAIFRSGLIPTTFTGLESAEISFAHVDVDIYQSIIDSLNFIWPRLTRGGFIVFDDYGWPSCPGARTAVDEFFADKSSIPLCLASGQALVFKGVAW